MTTEILYCTLSKLLDLNVNITENNGIDYTKNCLSKKIIKLVELNNNLFYFKAIIDKEWEWLISKGNIIVCIFKNRFIILKIFDFYFIEENIYESYLFHIRSSLILPNSNNYVFK